MNSYLYCSNQITFHLSVLMLMRQLVAVTALSGAKQYLRRSQMNKLDYKQALKQRAIVNMILTVYSMTFKS